jgi:DUF4097 and DUF4098 domain-containing protein YvlB
MLVRVAGLLLVALAYSNAAPAAERHLDRSFAVVAGGTLLVEADGSNISVTGNDDQKVVVSILVEGSDSAVESMTLAAEKQGNDVTVKAKRAKEGWKEWLFRGWNIRGSIKVQVPRNYHVDVVTSGGSLSTLRVHGNVTGKTSGGDIHLEEVEGTVRMKTSGGNVTAAQVTGDTNLNTSGGNIEAATVHGELSVQTSGGAIRLADIDGSVRARTSSGNVVATNVTGTVDLQTSGGDVRGERIDGRIRAHTSGGDVVVALAGANRGIDVSTSGGDIVVQVAPGTRGYIDASTSGGSVTSEIPVSVMESNGRELHGAINGGGETILARTSGGSIRLKTTT